MNVFERDWNAESADIEPETVAGPAADDRQDRLRMYRIPGRYVMDLFSALIDRKGLVAVPLIQWPEGANVVAVYSAPECFRSFIVHVQHDSFEPVPEGECIPDATEALEVEAVRVSFETIGEPGR